MNIKAYSVLDSKSAVYSKPHYAVTDGVAIRDIMDAAESPESQLNKYPEDFSLYAVGEFDDNTGKFDSYEFPRLVFRLTQAKHGKNTNEVSNDPSIQSST